MEVNLLSNVAKFQADKINFSRKMVRVMGIMASLWMVVLAIVMGFYWTSRISFTKTESSYKTLYADYLSMSEGVVINQNLRYKLKQVNQVLNQRFEYGKAFRQMENLFGAEVKVSGLELKEDRRFQLSGEVSSGELMDMVEKKVIDINGGKTDDFANAQMDSIKNIGDRWTFDLEVGLK